MLVAIAKKTLRVETSLYTFLQVVGFTVFEKTPILRVFDDAASRYPITDPTNQLNLFDI